MKSSPRPPRDRYVEEHPGYSYTGPDGATVYVPAAKATEAAAYVNEPMSRERANDICIAWGMAVGDAKVPIRFRPNGAGFDALIPLEVIGAVPAVVEWLQRNS